MIRKTTWEWPRPATEQHLCMLRSSCSVGVRSLPTGGTAGYRSKTACSWGLVGRADFCSGGRKAGLGLTVHHVFSLRRRGLQLPIMYHSISFDAQAYILYVRTLSSWYRFGLPWRWLPGGAGQAGWTTERELRHALRLCGVGPADWPSASCAPTPTPPTPLPLTITRQTSSSSLSDWWPKLREGIVCRAVLFPRSGHLLVLNLPLPCPQW